jgi:hypothetical protein
MISSRLAYKVRPCLKKEKGRVPMAHTYHPSYSEGRDEEEPSLGKQLMRPYLENTPHKIGLVEWLKW